MSDSRLLAASLTLASLLACGSSSAPPPNVPPELEHVAHVHRVRCGRCHVRVQPGQRTREELEAALARHHDRVRLSDAEWAKMVIYLAGPSDAGGVIMGDAQAR